MADAEEVAGRRLNLVERVHFLCLQFCVIVQTSNESTAALHTAVLSKLILSTDF